MPLLPFVVAPNARNAPSAPTSAELPIFGRPPTGLQQPSLAAAAAASPRVRTSSLRRIAETWWSTVRGETTRRAATSAFLSPSATSCRTSSSRPVRPRDVLARRRPRAAQAGLAELAEPATDDRRGGPGPESIELSVGAPERVDVRAPRLDEGGLVRAAERLPGRGGTGDVAGELTCEGLGNVRCSRRLVPSQAAAPDGHLAGDPAVDELVRRERVELCSRAGRLAAEECRLGTHEPERCELLEVDAGEPDAQRFVEGRPDLGISAPGAEQAGGHERGRPHDGAVRPRGLVGVGGSVLPGAGAERSPGAPGQEVGPVELEVAFGDEREAVGEEGFRLVPGPVADGRDGEVPVRPGGLAVEPSREREPKRLPQPLRAPAGERLGGADARERPRHELVRSQPLGQLQRFLAPGGGAVRIDRDLTPVRHRGVGERELAPGRMRLQHGHGGFGCAVGVVAPSGVPVQARELAQLAARFEVVAEAAGERQRLLARDRSLLDETGQGRLPGPHFQERDPFRVRQSARESQRPRVLRRRLAMRADPGRPIARERRVGEHRLRVSRLLGVMGDPNVITVRPQRVDGGAMEGDAPVGSDRALQREARELVPERDRTRPGPHDARGERLVQGVKLTRRERVEQDEVRLSRDDGDGVEQAACLRVKGPPRGRGRRRGPSPGRARPAPPAPP